MKQMEYTEKQKTVLEVLARVQRGMASYCTSDPLNKLCEKIKGEYNIKPPYLTLRDYLTTYGDGTSYHTFHFKILDKKILVFGLGSFLDDDLCILYPLTKQYYVVEDIKDDNGGDCETYHCDHYLQLEPKED